MLDRFELLRALNSQPLKLNGAAHRALEKTLNKAIAQMVVGLSLDAAKAAPESTRKAIAAGFAEALAMAELKKVSKLWDPKRAVPASIAHADLAGDLVALMEGQRRPFEPTRLGLAQARSLGEKDRAELVLGIQRLASLPQLKAILKKWDKVSPLSTGGDERAIRSALLALLQAP
jgi:hypothetical protein